MRSVADRTQHLIRRVVTMMAVVAGGAMLLRLLAGGPDDSSESGAAADDRCAADLDGSGTPDGADIQGFVTALVPGP